MSPALMDTLKYMLLELQSNRLEVAKYPGRHGGYVRGVMSANCEWYQRLCGDYARPRRRFPKIRTVIRRPTTVAALRRMIAGNLSGIYAERILDVARQLEYPGVPGVRNAA